MSVEVHRCAGRSSACLLEFPRLSVESLVSKFVFLLRQGTWNMFTTSIREAVEFHSAMLHICDGTCCPAALRCGTRGAEAKPCGEVHICARISVHDPDKRSSD